MKKYTAIISSILVIAVLFWANQAFADAIDTGATNHTGAIAIGFGDTANGRDYMCQGFVMSQYTTITAVGFDINGKNGDTNLGRKVWIDNSDTNSVPTGSVGVGIGGGTEITNAQLVTGSLTKYTLTTSVSVTIGNKYVLCMAPWNTTTHVWASDYQDIVSSTANPYAPANFTGAKRQHGDAAYTTWSAPDAGNDDILFDIYGTATASQSSSVNINKTSVNINKASVNIP